jgi:hypothetical protein
LDERSAAASNQFVALPASQAGFTDVAGFRPGKRSTGPFAFPASTVEIAKILFFIFLVIFLVLLLAGFFVGRKISGG